eukprot:s2996_g2.t1
MASPAKEIGAAMVAATAVPLALNWTDVIKTRMQGLSMHPHSASKICPYCGMCGPTGIPSPGCTVPAYTGGFLTVAQRVLAEEGDLAASYFPNGHWEEWWGGLLAALRRFLLLLPDLAMVPEAGLGSKFSAGAVLGALSGLLASPFDLVRIRVQAEAGRCDSGMLTTGLCAGQPQRIRGTVSGFKAVLSNGVLNIFRGSGINVVRSVCMTVGTVPVYEHSKHLAKSQGVADSPALHLGAGVVAGLAGTTVTAPADVVRTRIMQEGGATRTHIISAASCQRTAFASEAEMFKSLVEMLIVANCEKPLLEQSRSSPVALAARVQDASACQEKAFAATSLQLMESKTRSRRLYFVQQNKLGPAGVKDFLDQLPPLPKLNMLSLAENQSASVTQGTLSIFMALWLERASRVLILATNMFQADFSNLACTQSFCCTPSKKSLTKLQTCDRNEAELLQQLGRPSGFCRGLEELNLNANLLGSDQAMLCFVCAALPSTLRVLHLGASSLDGSNLGVMLPILNLPCLECLSFVQARLDDRGTAMLAEWLQKKPLPKLQQLDIRGKDGGRKLVLELEKTMGGFLWHKLLK